MPGLNRFELMGNRYADLDSRLKSETKNLKNITLRDVNNLFALYYSLELIGTFARELLTRFILADESNVQAPIQEAAFDDWCYYVDLDIKYAKSRWIEGIDKNGPRNRDLVILQMIADRSKIDRLRVLAQYFLKHHQAPCNV